MIAFFRTKSVRRASAELAWHRWGRSARTFARTLLRATSVGWIRPVLGMVLHDAQHQDPWQRGLGGDARCRTQNAEWPKGRGIGRSRSPPDAWQGRGQGSKRRQATCPSLQFCTDCFFAEGRVSGCIDGEHFNQLVLPARQACRHSFRRLQSQSRPVAGESAGRFELPLRGGPQSTDQEHAPPRSSAECRQARTGDNVQGPAGLDSRLQLICGWSVQIWQGHIEEKAKSMETENQWEQQLSDAMHQLSRLASEESRVQRADRCGSDGGRGGGTRLQARAARGAATGRPGQHCDDGTPHFEELAGGMSLCGTTGGQLRRREGTLAPPTGLSGLDGPSLGEPSCSTQPELANFESCLHVHRHLLALKVVFSDEDVCYGNRWARDMTRLPHVSG